jgi:DNA-binding PadR family transcriptional regulator
MHMSTPSEFLPLREPTFFILLSLADSEKHGYAILKDVELLSQGRVQLSSSTLYEALARLLDQGLVTKAATDRNNSAADNRPGRPRKFYQLTNTGQRVLDAELTRLQGLVLTAQQRLGLAGGR